MGLFDLFQNLGQDQGRGSQSSRPATLPSYVPLSGTINAGMNFGRKLLPRRDQATRTQTSQSYAPVLRETPQVTFKRKEQMDKLMQEYNKRAPFNVGTAIPQFVSKVTKPLGNALLREVATQRQQEMDLKAQGKNVQAALVPFSRPARIPVELTGVGAISRLSVGSQLDVASEISRALGAEKIEQFTPETGLQKLILGSKPIRPTSVTSGEIGLKMAERVNSGMNPAIAGGLAAFPIAFAGLEAIPGVGGAEAKASSIAAKYGDDGIRILQKLQKGESLLDEPVDIVNSIRNAVRKGPSIKQEGINITRLGLEPEAEATAMKFVSSIKDDLQEVKGAKLTEAEIIEDAKKSKLYQKFISREETAKADAAILALKNQISKGFEDSKNLSPEGFKALKENLEILRSVNADWGRRGLALRTTAKGADVVTAEKIVLDIVERGHKLDDVLKAADGVDFNDPQQLTKFYRTFIKPTFGETLNEFRYTNLLSSPKTHIVNAFSNLIQATTLAPTTKLATGALDLIHSKLTGKARTAYVSEVPVYYKGLLNSLGDATKSAIEVIQGKRFIERPDVATGYGIPTGVSLPRRSLQIIPRVLEASDVFFRTIIKQGEIEALTKRAMQSGGKVDMAKIVKEAEEKAAYYVFRQPANASKESGQGHILRWVDFATEGIYKFRKVPGVGWIIPFVQTPMNIVKQGFEYSPAGFATIYGAANKTEQLAKAMIGSTVFAGTGAVAMNTETTWAVPTSPKERAAFYSAGLKPYSIKIGDTWVSINKLGPLSYPMAMALAVKYEFQQDPKRFDRGTVEKLGRLFSDMSKYFSDQSYVDGIGNLVELAQGGLDTKQKIDSFVGNLSRQAVPLVALQGWVTRMIDPIYRDAKSIPEILMKGIPGLSTRVEPYRDLSGEPSKIQLPIINAFSPLELTKTNENFAQDLLNSKPAQEQYERLKALPRDTANKEMQRLYMDNKTLYTAIKKEQTWDGLGITKEDRQLANKGVENGDRARSIIKTASEFQTQGEKNDYYDRLFNAGLITDKVRNQIQLLQGGVMDLRNIDTGRQIIRPQGIDSGITRPQGL